MAKKTDNAHVEALAEHAYRAYNASTGGLNFRGETCPLWGHITNTAQGEAWRATVLYVLDAVKADPDNWKTLPDPGWPADPHAPVSA